MKNNQEILKVWLIENQNKRMQIYNGLKTASLSDEDVYSFLEFTIKNKERNYELRLRQFDWCMCIMSKIKDAKYKEKAIREILLFIRKGIFENSKNYKSFKKQILSLRENSGFNLFSSFKDIEPELFKKIADKLLQEKEIKDFIFSFKEICLQKNYADLSAHEKSRWLGDIFNFGNLINEIEPDDFARKYHNLHANISYFMNKTSLLMTEAMNINIFFMENFGEEIIKLSDKNLKTVICEIKKKKERSFFDNMLCFWLFDKQEEFKEKNNFNMYLTYSTNKLFTRLKRSNKNAALKEFINTEWPLSPHVCDLEDFVKDAGGAIYFNEIASDFRKRLEVILFVADNQLRYKSQSRLSPELEFSFIGEDKKELTLDEMEKIHLLLNLKHRIINNASMPITLLEYYHVLSGSIKNSFIIEENIRPFFCEFLNKFFQEENIKFFDIYTIVEKHFDFFNSEQKMRIMTGIPEGIKPSLYVTIQTTSNENLKEMFVMIDKEILEKNIKINPNKADKKNSRL